MHAQQALHLVWMNDILLDTDFAEEIARAGLKLQGNEGTTFCLVHQQITLHPMSLQIACTGGSTQQIVLPGIVAAMIQPLPRSQ